MSKLDVIVKKTNMKNFFKDPINLLIYGGIIIVILSVVSSGSSRKLDLENQKLDICIKQMNAVIPDPNDDSRASFLKNCYEK